MDCTSPPFSLRSCCSVSLIVMVALGTFGFFQIQEKLNQHSTKLEIMEKDLTINMLGPVGDKVEEWILKGCMVTEANFGDLAFDTDDPTEVTLTVQQDLCILNY